MPGEWRYTYDPVYRDLVDAGVIMLEALDDGRRERHLEGWGLYERMLRHIDYRLPRGEHPLVTALRRYLGRSSPLPEATVLAWRMEVGRRRLPGLRHWPTAEVCRHGVS